MPRSATACSSGRSSRWRACARARSGARGTRAGRVARRARALRAGRRPPEGARRARDGDGACAARRARPPHHLWPHLLLARSRAAARAVLAAPQLLADGRLRVRIRICTLPNSNTLERNKQSRKR